jgi:hypothetical protein
MIGPRRSRGRILPSLAYDLRHHLYRLFEIIA